mmetsp:Transcript_15062/g.41272  ORF Transcript_15062/g.41272 Transcript_15062/m.41272 type:complete len:243 (-) Transcript_15062:247-975(-)
MPRPTPPSCSSSPPSARLLRWPRWRRRRLETRSSPSRAPISSVLQEGARARAPSEPAVGAAAPTAASPAHAVLLRRRLHALCPRGPTQRSRRRRLMPRRKDHGEEHRAQERGGEQRRASSSPGRGPLPERGEELVLHGLLGEDPRRMVVDEHPVDEVHDLVADEMLVLGVHELLPWLSRVPAQNVVELRIELLIVFVEVLKQAVRAQDLGDLDQLIVVVLPLEEGLLLEHHPSKHATEAPHI